MKFIIAENGNFPPQYNVLQEGEDGIFRVVFGPDPDLIDAQRKHQELSAPKKVEKKESVKKETVKKTPAKKKTVTKKKTVKK